MLNGAISILSPIVPATQAEINKQILEQLGPAPAAPTLTEPTYDGEIPPEVANPGARPNRPDPNDYVPDNGWSDYRYYEYQYNSTTGKYQRRYLRTSGRYSDWEDIADPADYVAALEAYNNYDAKLKEYNDYLAKIEELKKDPAYQAYLAEKQAYDNEWAAYNDELADYNEQADAIREAAGGAETHYNTIRYLEFEVTNEQGMKATFRVMQYPIIYITHVMGYYSYRDDFNGTTWEKRGN